MVILYRQGSWGGGGSQGGGSSWNQGGYGGGSSGGYNSYGGGSGSSGIDLTSYRTFLRYPLLAFLFSNVYKPEVNCCSYLKNKYIQLAVLSCALVFNE